MVEVPPGDIRSAVVPDEAGQLRLEVELSLQGKSQIPGKEGGVILRDKGVVQSRCELVLGKDQIL
jgi:hypothetical protein